MAVLLIRPEADATEQVLSKVASDALSRAPVPGAQSLTPPLPPPGSPNVPQPLTRATVDQAITAGPHPVHILYFGHGRRTQLGDPTVLIDSATFPHLKNALVLALACSSSERLGPDAVSSGVRAWVGFTRPIPVPLTQRLLPNLEPFRVAAAVTLKGDPAADIEKQTRDAFEKRADTIVNSASQANQAQYAQAVVDSLVERGLASTFRADGDRTATL